MNRVPAEVVEPARSPVFRRRPVGRVVMGDIRECRSQPPGLSRIRSLPETGLLTHSSDDHDLSLGLPEKWSPPRFDRAALPLPGRAVVLANQQPILRRPIAGAFP